MNEEKIKKINEELLENIRHMNNLPMYHDCIYMNLNTMRELTSLMLFMKPIGEMTLYGLVVINDQTLQDGEIVIGRKIELYKPQDLLDEQEIKVEVEIK